MFEDVIYDRALFNLNLWKDMTITPRHKRQFCEVTYKNRKIYTDEEIFVNDTKLEYKQLPNALLMLRLVTIELLNRVMRKIYGLFIENTWDQLKNTALKV